MDNCPSFNVYLQDYASKEQLPSFACLLQRQGLLVGGGKEVMMECASKGNCAGLKLLHEHGCVAWKGITALAAQEGFLDILQLAHSAGAPWDKETTSAAAKAGHLSCLRFAHEHGCPWSPNTLLSSVGNWNCFNYTLDHGRQWDERVVPMVAERSLRALQEIVQGGYTWTAECLSKCMSNAARAGSLPTLEFLLA